jgi:hypothetical protein
MAESTKGTKKAADAETAKSEPAFAERDQAVTPPMPRVVAPEGLTLEGLSVNPDPDEVRDGRALDAAHTDHDDVSNTREGASTRGQRSSMR